MGRAQGGPVHRCVPFAESPLFLIPAPSLLPGDTSQMNHVHPNPVPSTALGRGGYNQNPLPSPSLIPPSLAALLTPRAFKVILSAPHSSHLDHIHKWHFGGVTS